MDLDWLDRLREKPEHVRFRIALLAAGVVTALIFIVWFSIITFVPGERGQDAKEVSQESGSASDFRESFSEFLRSSGEQFNGLFDAFGTVHYEAEDPSEE